MQDELQGDGTSGLYHLSRAPIVIGSDKLHIEVRDRFEITRVVETHELSRFIDYDLDYERGTVFFKEPVPSRDHELNPVFIVADYEVRTGGEDETAAGVRVATKLAADKLEIGASAVFQGAQAGDTHIIGSDLTWRVTPETKVRAEVAQSQSDDPLRPDASTAWLVEGNHASEHLEARAWARETGAAFGVDQQLTADTGTRSAGVDARYKFTESLTVSGEVQHQDVLASDANRMLVSADVRMNKSGYSVGVGARHVADQDASGDDRISDQAFVNGTLDVWDGRVTLRGSHDASLGTTWRRERERGLSGAKHSRRRLPRVRRHHAIRRIRTRGRQPDRIRHDANRHAHASLGAHAAEVEPQYAGHRIWSAHVRELRSHAGIPVERTLGLRYRRRPDATRCAARTSSR